MRHSDSGETQAQSKRSPKKSKVSNEPKLKCSYCRKDFLRSETRHMPFCSKRCQQVDLGMWLTEGYGIPYEGDSMEQRFERNEIVDEDFE